MARFDLWKNFKQSLARRQVEEHVPNEKKWRPLPRRAQRRCFNRIRAIEGRKNMAKSRSGTSPKTNRGQQEEQEQDNGMDNELHELFLEELADVHNAEQQLTKALPKMAKAANSDELREAFETHLEETQEHISRLEQVAKSLDETIKRKKCAAMEGLLEEGQEIMQELKDSSALDAGLILAAQKVEHYEMASYGGLCAWAEQMGHQEALDLLKETLEEEKATDEKLTQIAENAANQQAEQE
jgi:ferritin-like metal-binding protein YciE